MFFQNLNYITIIIAAVAAVALGYVWYSQWAFGKRFLRELGVTEAMSEEMRKSMSKGKMAKTYAVTTLLAVITSVVVAALLNSLVVIGYGGLILLAVSVWAAFTLPIAANNVTYGKDTLVLFVINAGYQLVAIVLVTLILGIFG